MKRVLGYSLVGLLAYGFFMLVQFPATTLADWVTQSITGLSIQHVHGSAVQGSARDIRLQGMGLASLTWRMRILPLLTGRMEYRVSVEEGDMQLDAIIGTSFTRRWRVTGLKGQIPLPKALSLVSELPSALDGDLILNNAEVSLDRDGAFYSADGNLQLVNIRTTFTTPSQLGDFIAELSAEKPNLLVALKDSGGPLEFSGTFNLAPDYRYQFRGNVKLRDNADEQLRDALNFIGQVSGDGRWQLELSGTLKTG